MAKKKKSVKKKPIKKSKEEIHAEQLQHMKDRYGTNSMWGNANLYLTHDEVENYFGPQCEDYNPQCGCCKAWLEWHETGRVNIIFEREDFVRLMGSGEI